MGSLDIWRPHRYFVDSHITDEAFSYTYIMAWSLQCMSRETMSTKPSARGSDALELIKAALVGLKFGEIVVDVHDGEIVQIARTEKLRPKAR